LGPAGQLSDVIRTSLASFYTACGLFLLRGLPLGWTTKCHVSVRRARSATTRVDSDTQAYRCRSDIASIDIKMIE